MTRQKAALEVSETWPPPVTRPAIVPTTQSLLSLLGLKLSILANAVAVISVLPEFFGFWNGHLKRLQLSPIWQNGCAAVFLLIGVAGLILSIRDIIKNLRHGNGIGLNVLGMALSFTPFFVSIFLDSQLANVLWLDPCGCDGLG